jgi:hypothetical protein
LKERHKKMTKLSLRATGNYGEKITGLRRQHEELSRQQGINRSHRRGLQNDPRLLSCRNEAADLMDVMVTWQEVQKARQTLAAGWRTNADKWNSVSTRRTEAAEAKPKVRHLPFVAVAGMISCWIAQWLWWAGYIGVAGDDYCPPKLPLIVSIWTIFSALGTTFGTSF